MHDERAYSHRVVSSHLVGRAALAVAVASALTACAYESHEAGTEVIDTAAVFPGVHEPDDDGTTAPRAAADVELQSGVPVPGLAAPRRAERRFHIAVPAGARNLRFVLAGGTGDADLYVRFNAVPTTSDWDFRSERNGNAESIAATPVREGTYHVLVRAYRAFAGATLTATFDPPLPDDGGGADAGAGLDCRNAASWPADWTQFEDQVLALINARRAAGATCGVTVHPAVGPVVMDADLREAARCHSLDMAVNGYFSHESQDGRSPWDRIAEAGYTASPTAENIAAGYGTPELVVEGWMTSEGHCNNIMNGRSNETGLGYAFHAGSPFGRYWTETFGHR